MIQIKNRWDDSIIFTSEESSTSLHAVEKAVAEKVCLDGASLDGARLDGASLDAIRNDFWDVLIRAKNEVSGLRLALIEGRVDGSTYEGKCACLVGTIANVKHCNYNAIDTLKPDSNRPIERFFMGIAKGDKPETNQVSKIVVGWIDEFQALTGESK